MLSKFMVNGVRVSLDVEPRTSLLDVLRDALNLTGTHAGCEHGVCGACTVIVDGEAVRSCLMLAVQAHKREVRTVEGLSRRRGRLSTLQDAFCETHATQCGYCTSGFLMSAAALLERTSSPSLAEIEEAISGNLCRCTGYRQIIEAIELAAGRLRERNLEDLT